MAIEAKQQMPPQSVFFIAEQLKVYQKEFGTTGGLAVAPYLSPRARELLITRGINFIDATGNMRLVIDKPALFIEAQGAGKDPWREKRPLVSLKGSSAGRVVRALCDFRPPYGIRELAQRAGLSLGSASRVAALLERDAILTKAGRGRIVSVDWQALIMRWVQDYSFDASNTVGTFLEPRGLKALLDKMKNLKMGYAITGSLAATHHAPAAPARLATIFVKDMDRASSRLKLNRTEAGTNVILAEPFGEVVFERLVKREGLSFAAPSQVAADLLTGPGRSPAEAETLMDWMSKNEDEWRL